jgi:hypothetical protein
MGIARGKTEGLDGCRKIPTRANPLNEKNVLELTSEMRRQTPTQHNPSPLRV